MFEIIKRIFSIETRVKGHQILNESADPYNPYTEIINNKIAEKRNKNTLNLQTQEIDGAYHTHTNITFGLNFIIVADTDYIEENTYQKLSEIISSQRVDAILFLGDIRNKFIEKITDMARGKLRLGVLGNHDYFGQLEDNEIVNLNCSTANIDNIRITGLEGSWKYKDVEYPSYTQKEAILKCEQLSGTDILICHNSPAGIHESDTNAHQGFTGISRYIDKNTPGLVLHGHQHRNLITVLDNGTTVIGIYGVAFLNNGGKISIL